jgi:alpha-mannosidase
MHKHPKITEDRIRKTIDRIRPLVHRAVAPLRIESWRVGGEPVPYAVAVSQAFSPGAAGELWGVPWDTVWFRFHGKIPAQWAGSEVVALIKLGAKAGEGFTCEGQVWRDGRPTRAINAFRSDVPLAAPAAGGEDFEFYVEAAANPNADGGAYRIAPRGQTAPIFRIEQAELACIDRDAQAYLDDFRLCAETLPVLPAESPRRAKLLYALNASANVFDPADAASIPAARQALAGVLSRHNGDSAHQISAIGHAHIDTAWLWPLRETIRKCARTFSTALAYMEEYPAYVFGCSQPQQYAWMKAYYPTIYEGIRQAIRRGQWEPIGSMWIEPDCNIPSGESLVRQILHGKNFFLDEFGYETTQLWIPDVFGYSAALPQILRQSGIDYFVTQKISWNQLNKFPHHTFLWEGLDGTRIFSHFPPADTYNADLFPNHLKYAENNFREHDRANRSLFVYGWGDGGGGPTKGMLEAALRLRDFEGLPKVTQEKVSVFLAKAQEDAQDLPVWVGELYLELHRGTYTTQARTKRANRKCEQLLHGAEFFSVLAPAAGVAEIHSPRPIYDCGREGEHTVAAYLDRAWKLLLLNQFHDIIPGSSIDWVYEDSARDYAAIAELCGAVAEPARREIAGAIDTGAARRPIIVFNPTGFPRQEVAALPDGTLMWVEAPPCGYAVNDRAAPADIPPVRTSTHGGKVTLDNGILRVDVDTNGQLAAIFDHRAGRQVLAPGKPGNVLQLHRDYPNNWDAWDIDIFTAETCEEIRAVESLEVLEDHPLRATVRVVRRFGNSTLTQAICLSAGSPRLDFLTEVDWQESRKLLKAAFPVNVHSMRAAYETQFGHVERPTHYNTSWDLARFEVCAHRWADLAEGDYGVALLNDCKYGYDIAGHTMRLSLLRAPGAPDPAADRGRHEFTYSLLPHPGDFQAGGVVAAANALNYPLQLVEVASQSGSLPERETFFSVDQPGVVIEAIKKAEKENAVIVRLYEAHNCHCRVTFRTTLSDPSIATADLMEHTLKPLECHDSAVVLEIAPFEIVTLKIMPR